MSFSEKLQCLRKDKKLSQEDFAEIMNVSRQAVSKWELGQAYPDIEKLVDISNYFNVSLDYLVKNETLISKEGSLETEDVKLNNTKSLSTIRKRVYLSLAIICSCICSVALPRIGQNQNRYQSIILGIYCIVGITASLFVVIKVKKLSKGE